MFSFFSFFFHKAAQTGFGERIGSSCICCRKTTGHRDSGMGKSKRTTIAHVVAFVFTHNSNSKCKQDDSYILFFTTVDCVLFGLLQILWQLQISYDSRICVSQELFISILNFNSIGCCFRVKE